MNKILQKINISFHIKLQKANKMIRFVTEREIDISASSKNRRNRSQLAFHLSSPYEMNESNFRVISNLKKIDQQNQYLQKRVNVLFEQGKRMQSKTIQNHTKLQFYKTLRNQINQQKKAFEEYRKDATKQMQITKSIIMQQRQHQQKKLEQSKRRMYFQRWQNYLNQRQGHRKSIEEIMLKNQQQKYKNRLKIQQIKLGQTLSRLKVQQKLEKKIYEIRSVNQVQGKKSKKQHQRKLTQTDSLTNLQSLLLSRQSKLKTLNEFQQNIIQKYLKPHKIKSPERSFRKKCQSFSDIYII